MDPLADLRNALRGWSGIVAGRPDAGRYFRADAAGLGIAVAAFGIALLVSVAVQSAGTGLPSLTQVVLGLAAQAITVSLLALAMRWALRFVKSPTPFLDLFVPVLYALAAMLIIAIPLLLIGPNLGLLAILALGVLISRAAAVLAGLKPPPAAGLAVLCVIVLVVVPAALYMLLTLVPSA